MYTIINSLVAFVYSLSAYFKNRSNMECAATHGSHAAYMALCSLYNIFFFGVRGITRSIYEFYEEIVVLSNHLERMFPHTKKNEGIK